MPPLDEEKTAPFSLGQGERACLLIHGFTGSPWDMLPLGEALAKRGFAVHGLRLSGHGQTSQAMLPVRYTDWQNDCEVALKNLAASHRSVFLIGLSMGALLSILLAAKDPDSVRALVLLAPAVRLRGRAVQLIRRPPFVNWIPRLLPWIRKTATDIADPAERASAPILPGFPTARLQDLWTLQDLALKEGYRVRAPTLIIVAKNDRVVDNEGAREITRSLVGAPSTEFVELTRGRHVIPRDYGREEATEKIYSFLDALEIGGLRAGPDWNRTHGKNTTRPGD